MSWYDKWEYIYGEDEFGGAAGWFWLEVETPDSLHLLGEPGDGYCEPPYCHMGEMGADLSRGIASAKNWDDLAKALGTVSDWRNSVLDHCFEGTFGSYDCVMDQEQGSYVLDFSKLKRIFFFGVYYDECDQWCYNFETKECCAASDQADHPIDKLHNGNFGFIVDEVFMP